MNSFLTFDLSMIQLVINISDSKQHVEDRALVHHPNALAHERL